MGLLDDIKCSAKNVANKGDEAYNTAKYKNEIDTLERDIEKIYTKIGKAYYNNSANKESEFDKIPEFVEEINKAGISELNFVRQLSSILSLDNCSNFSCKSSKSYTLK